MSNSLGLWVRTSRTGVQVSSTFLSISYPHWHPRICRVEPNKLFFYLAPSIWLLIFKQDFFPPCGRDTWFGTKSCHCGVATSWSSKRGQRRTYRLPKRRTYRLPKRHSVLFSRAATSPGWNWAKLGRSVPFFMLFFTILIVSCCLCQFWAILTLARNKFTRALLGVSHGITKYEMTEVNRWY